MPSDELRKVVKTNTSPEAHIDTKKAEEWKAAVEQVIDKLVAEYKVEPFTLSLLRVSDLKKVGEAFGSLENLQGKRILDLGCGSIRSTDEVYGRKFEPWFCRALQELGAHPVGIDIGYLDKEKFEHYRLDLSRPGALNIFPDKSFDGINCNSFFDSPTLDHLIGYDAWQRVEARMEGRKLEDRMGPLQKEIGAQIRRLLKNDGKLLTTESAGGNDLKPQLGLE